MASTRSDASTDTPKQAFLALVRHGARIHLAACTAATRTLTEWAQTTDRYAQSLADELLHCVDGESDSAELVARITAASSVHLRELRALPHGAADHFDARLARVPATTRRFR